MVFDLRFESHDVNSSISQANSPEIPLCDLNKNIFEIKNSHNINLLVRKVR